MFLAACCGDLMPAGTATPAENGIHVVETWRLHTRLTEWTAISVESYSA